MIFSSICILFQLKNKKDLIYVVLYVTMYIQI
jgi:hypothetical protein